MARRPARKAKAPATVEVHIEQPGPTEISDPLIRREFARAAVWLGMALAIAGIIFLAQPLLLIVGGLVFSVVLDGGARLLGRVLPIHRGWRLLIVTLAGFGFIGWVFWFAGTTFIAQFEVLRAVVTAQFHSLVGWAERIGLMHPGSAATFGDQLLGSAGRLTSAVGSALGALASGLMILVIGIFIAMEPRLYDRGLAWMLPVRHRTRFYVITNRVGYTLRRLMFGRIVGMIFEGVFTWLMLAYVGQLFGFGAVPMAALLGLITGVLAFLPNIGAPISGVLMVAVGFSAGPSEGLWAIFVYFFVQNIDGYFVVPYIARRTVDLPPALVLAAQLIFGALFGILGLLLADPIVASIKVTLQELSRSRQAAKRPKSVEAQSPG
jgi:predicted PurR-regulated permease PerM